MTGYDAKQQDSLARPQSDRSSQPMRLVGLLARRVAVYGGCLLLSLASYGAYEHFKIHNELPQSLASLITAAGFALVPVRALVREFLAIEGKILHWLHGAGALALIALSLSGVISGGPLLSHAAIAPFAVMGAAQAVMHQNQPRSPEQAEALRRFATSLPEVAQFTQGNLASPENALRAVAVLSDLVQKAQVLGETELRSDPGFQGALMQVGTRFGLSIGLDIVDRTITELAANPVAVGAVPALRQHLAEVRKQLNAPKVGSTSNAPG